MLEIVIEIDGAQVKATAFGSRMERPAPQVVGEVAELEAFGKKVGRAVRAGKPLEAPLVEEAQRLHDALFQGEIRDVVTRIRAESPNEKFLVRLMMRNRAVQTIPWEALCIPGTSEGFLGAGTRMDLARGVSSSEPTKPEPVQGAIRLLTIAPTGETGMDNLKAAVESAITSGRLTWLEPVVGEHASARRLFQRLRSEQPAHVIHFIGHGGVDVDGHPTLRLADDEYGDPVWIKAEMLAGELAAGFGKELRLVVLEACEGASPGLLGSAAEIIARAGAQAVIAYLWPVRADDSRTCSEEFYRELLTSDRGRGDVAKSLSAARRTLLLQSAAGFSPVLYLRGADPVLFDFGVRTAQSVAAPPAAPVEAPKFFVPFKQNPIFVGRKDEIEELHTLLQARSTTGACMVALSGMGGIGKTQIAAEYAYRFRDAYPDGVYWVNAAQDWETELARLAVLVGCRAGDGPEHQKHHRLAHAFADVLRARSRALLIFDNVDNPLELQDATLDVVPANLECKLLFTTRRRELPWPEVFVGVLPDEAALELLLMKSSRKKDFERMPKSEQDAALAVCNTLGGHPLAIALGAAYLESYPRISFAGYLEGLRTEGALAVMDATRIDARRLATQHAGNVGATLNVQWRSIESDGARLVLQTAALLGESIPRPRLALLTGLSDEPRSWREAPLEEALRELSRLSLLERFTSADIKLHRLVRELIEKQIPERDVFAAARAEGLLATLWDVKRLESEVAKRGAIEVLTDLNVARALAKSSDHERFDALIRPLDREAHSLRHWKPEEQPGFFLQQLRNQALELGIDTIRQNAEAVLQKAKVSWFEQRFAASGESAALVRTLEGHTQPLYGVALSADGRFAISCGADNTIKVWDWATGRCIRTLEGHTKPVAGLAVTPDGQRILSTSEDTTVRVWDFETGHLLQTLERHTKDVYRVAITPDGRFAISASKDGTLRVWDLSTGDAIRTLERPAGSILESTYHLHAVTDVVVTHDGRFAISSSQVGNLTVWDVATWRIVRTLEGHTGPVWTVAASASNRFVVSGSEDGTIKRWDVMTGTMTHSLELESNVLAVTLTHDDRLVVAGLRNGDIKVWDWAKGQVIRTFKGHSHYVVDVVTTLDGRFAISVSGDGTVKVWDLGMEMTARRSEGHDGGVYGVTFSPDGQYAISASLDQTIKIHDLASGAALRTLRGHAAATLDVALSPDGRYLVSASDDKTLRVWDFSTGEVLRTLEGHTDKVRGVAVSPDGRYVVSASYDMTVRVWDLATGLIHHVFEGHQLGVRDVVVTPDGRFAISASFDRTLKVWDLELGQLVHTLEGHLGAIWSLTLTPDGRFVVSGAQDKTIKIWEVVTGQLVRTLEGHTDHVLGVAVTSDGGFVLSVSGDTSLKSWDIATGQQCSSLEHSAPLSSCAASPQGFSLVVGTSSGSVLVLDLRQPEVLLQSRLNGPAKPLLEVSDLIGQAALDILLGVPKARQLFDEGGPDERKAALLVAQTLGRASPAIELAAGYFDTHPEPSFVDYVDALGLEVVVETNVFPIDPAFWTKERIEIVRNAAFDVSWREMTDPTARLVLCTVAIFAGNVPPSCETLALFAGLSESIDSSAQPGIETVLREIMKRGWIEPKSGIRQVCLRPQVHGFLLRIVSDWPTFARERLDAFGAVFKDMERMEREVARRGVHAVSGDLRIGLLVAMFSRDPSVLETRWRVFSRESHCLAKWDPKALPALFLQQMRNRALELGEEETRQSAEAVLDRRRLSWLRERFAVNRESTLLARTYRGHGAEVRCVAFVPIVDRIQIVSGADDRTVRVWDSVTGLVCYTLEGHAGAINALAVSRDGRFVVSASEDKTLRKWDLWTGTVVRTFEGHKSGVRRVALDAQAKIMISAAADYVVHLWDFETGKILQVIGGQDDPVTWMVTSPDGTRAVYATPGEKLFVQQFDGTAWKQVHVLEGHTDRVLDLVMMADGQSVMTSSADGTIKLWNIETGRLLHSLEGHTGPVGRVIPSGDDHFAVSVSEDKTVRLWDLREAKQLRVLHGHTDQVWGLEVLWPEGLAISASADGTLRLWTLGQDEPERRMEGHWSPVFGVAISPDGRFAVSASQDKTLRIWELSTGQCLRTLEGHSDVVVGVCFTPDGKTILSSGDDGQVRIWDFATGELLRVVEHGDRRARAVVVTPDGQFALTACHDKLVRVWELTTGNVVRVLEGHTDRVRTLALLPDGRHVISGSFDNTLRVWEWSTGKTVRVLQGHGSAVWSVAVTPDGRYAISTSFDRTLRVWELSTGRLLRTLEGHSDWVLGVVAALDGIHVISTSRDTTMAIWNLHTGRRVGFLVASGPLYCIALTPDGKTIVTGDGGGAVHIIDIVG